MPTLADGEFYFAEDRAQLYVGFLGTGLKVANMAVPIQDSAGNNLTSTASALDVNIKSNTDTPISTVQQGGTSGLVGDAQTKGVQGTIALMVQDFKDAGRSKVILSSTKAAAIATEALVNLTQKKGDTTTVVGTTYTVTAGKTLRIQSLFLGITGTTTTEVTVAVRVREGAAGGGAVSATSDIIAELEAGTQAAAALANGQIVLGFNDGLEVAGGQQIGITELASSTSGTVTIVLVGFEY
jgi:hypothetical protein